MVAGLKGGMGAWMQGGNREERRSEERWHDGVRARAKRKGSGVKGERDERARRREGKRMIQYARDTH